MDLDPDFDSQVKCQWLDFYIKKIKSPCTNTYRYVLASFLVSILPIPEAGMQMMEAQGVRAGDKKV